MKLNRRQVLCGGLVVLGTLLLYVGTLGLYAWNGDVLPQRGLFRSLPEPMTDYVLVDTDDPDASSDDPPWYLAASPGFRYFGSYQPERDEIPAAVYARGASLAHEARQREAVRAYNALRGTQVGGLALVLAGGVGLVWPRRARRKKIVSSH